MSNMHSRELSVLASEMEAVTWMQLCSFQVELVHSSLLCHVLVPAFLERSAGWMCYVLLKGAPCMLVSKGVCNHAQIKLGLLNREFSQNMLCIVCFTQVSVQCSLSLWGNYQPSGQKMCVPPSLSRLPKGISGTRGQKNV